MITQVLLAGGGGLRVAKLLKGVPKQFARLVNSSSTFMLALERARYISNEIVIVTNKKYLDFVLRDIFDVFDLQDARDITILLEGESCNTMSAAFHALSFLDRRGSAVVAPCDHLIPDILGYKNLILGAELENEAISLIGLKPKNFLESTLYGNILIKNNQVLGFFEKPDLNFLIDKISEFKCEHLWNSGVFILDIRCVLDQLIQFFGFNKLNISFQSIKSNLPIEKIFVIDKIGNDAQNVPFDFLIQKIFENVKVFESGLDWIDIGSKSKILELLGVCSSVG